MSKPQYRLRAVWGGSTFIQVLLVERPSSAYGGETPAAWDVKAQEAALATCTGADPSSIARTSEDAAFTEGAVYLERAEPVQLDGMFTVVNWVVVAESRSLRDLESELHILNSLEAERMACESGREDAKRDRSEGSA